MALIETPGLLIYGEESEYLSKYREIFSVNHKIIIPEYPTKELLVYTNNDKVCQHFRR